MWSDRTFHENVQRMSRKIVVGEIETSLPQLLYLIGIHLKELLQEPVEEQTSCMLSKIAKSMKIRHTLSLT